MRNIFLLLLIIAPVVLTAQKKSKKINTQTIAKVDERLGIKEDFSVRKKSPEVREGLYRYYYNGHKLTEGSYSNDKKEGIWKYYNGYGQLTFQGEFLNGDKNGKWSYYDDDTLVSETSYKNGLKDGEWKGYFKNGSVASLTRYINNKVDGISYTYYENGKMHQLKTFASGNLSGTFKEFFSNGALHSEIIYKDGSPFSLISIFDKGGISLDGGDLRDGNGKLISYYNEPDTLSKKEERKFLNGKPEGYYVSYYQNGMMYAEGQYEVGERNGEWKFFKENGELEKTKNYSDEPVGKSADPTLPRYDEVFTIVEAMPEFPGGESELLKFLSKIIYPPIAKERDIEGQVFIQFVVDQIGEVVDVEVVKGAHELLNNAAAEHIKKVPRWTPGKQNGVPVKVQYVVPLKFRLE